MAANAAEQPGPSTQPALAQCHNAQHVSALPAQAHLLLQLRLQRLQLVLQPHQRPLALHHQRHLLLAGRRLCCQPRLLLLHLAAQLAELLPQRSLRLYVLRGRAGRLPGGGGGRLAVQRPAQGTWRVGVGSARLCMARPASAC